MRNSSHQLDLEARGRQLDASDHGALAPEDVNWKLWVYACVFFSISNDSHSKAPVATSSPWTRLPVDREVVLLGPTEAGTGYWPFAICGSLSPEPPQDQKNNSTRGNVFAQYNAVKGWKSLRLPGGPHEHRCETGVQSS